ncbi:ABC transporter permease [bacterium]|nr:ABC transporter permease [bacterium]
MLINLIKTAVRNMLRHKGYSAINIIGLALGLACSLLIFLWVTHELSYDSFHSRIDDLYRIEQDQFYNDRRYHVTVTPYPMGEGVKEDIPEIVDACRYVFMPSILFRYDEKSFFQGGLRCVDPSLLNMFDFKLSAGDPATAFSDPHSVVLTQEVAEKYFGSDDPLGKTLVLNNEYSFKVTGIIAEAPDNSTINFQGLMPFEFLKEIGRYSDSWGANSIVTYVQLHDQADITAVNDKITQLRQNRVAEGIEDMGDRTQFMSRKPTQFMVAPMQDIHLHAYFGYGKPTGDIQYVYIFSVIASFVLLIACINFMNLSTARSAKRAREVGLRKVVGAKRSHLVAQFIGESMTTAILALIVAMVLVMLMLPAYNQLSGKAFTISHLLNPSFFTGVVLITLLTGLISGSYPAIFLSSFMPIRVLKGSLSGAKGKTFRRVLVVIQFSLSVFLIIGTSIVYKQVKFMRDKPIGYEQEHLIYMGLRGNAREKYQTLKAELQRETEVISVTGSGHQPHQIGSNSSGSDWEGKDENFRPLISQSIVGYDFASTMKIDIAEGRDFETKFTGDTASAFLVNETLANMMNKETVVGESFSFMGVDGHIVGVMKDYHYQSVRLSVEPLAVICYPPRVSFAIVRLDAKDMKVSLAAVEKVWNRVNPRYPFEYDFVDEQVARMYRVDQAVGSLLKYFAILAIVIASLGLFGLSAFTAEQRTKEIGVRKVLGASVSGIVLLLGKEFARWVLLANLLACPAAFFIMRNWLSAYAYRTSLSWWVFGLSIVLSMAVALVTVSYQSIRAALINPARSLNYE